MLRDRENPAHGVRFWKYLQDAVGGFVDLLYPPLCLHCRARISPHSILCTRCRSRLETVDEAETQRLLDRLESAAIDAVVAVWYFDKGSPLQDVQHALKYGNRPVCGSWMGAHLGRACRAGGAHPHEIVMPIPLHRTRLLERGYNQSEIIAEAVATALRLPLRAGILRRTRSTETQTNLSRAERRRNLESVFAVTDPGAVAGRHILLIDDVTTTGATFEAAADVLKVAGATSVTAAAVGLARN